MPAAGPHSPEQSPDASLRLSTESRPGVGHIKSVTVYCSSSRKVDQVYFDAAQRLGEAIGRRGWQLVYGGNNVGLMNAVATSARASGGVVVGITPQRMFDEGIVDRSCDELVVTAGMRERKALLEQRGDALVALPGGLGTLEEFFETLVGKTLGYHDKPIILVNIAAYYDPLLNMIRDGIERKFVRPEAADAFFVAQTVDEAINRLCDLASGRCRARCISNRAVVVGIGRVDDASVMAPSCPKLIATPTICRCDMGCCWPIILQEPEGPNRC